jgi:hypothetical protein
VAYIFWLYTPGKNLVAPNEMMIEKEKEKREKE